uniref:Growth factor receptor domain-containing protein n=1 Tax=Monopterus albus TaxID=43700 RepID=A0A3Q3QHN7_MONAL
RCQPCHGSCQTCHGPRSTDCELCLGGNRPLRGQCPLVNCPLGQYFDGKRKYVDCRRCDASCKTCFGPQALDCSSCFKGANIYCLHKTLCNTCVTGYFLDQDNCSPNCETCVDTSDNCISCSKGSYKLFLHQGQCWSNCPEGFFETAEGSCEACDSSCRTCDGIKSQCLSCADGHYLESGMCRLNCSLRTYPADDGTCRRCPPHCDVCSDDRTCFMPVLLSCYIVLFIYRCMKTCNLI